MRKFVVFILFAALLLGLTGCGKKDSAEDKLIKAIKDIDEFDSETSDDSDDSDSEEVADQSSGETSDSEINTVFKDFLVLDSSDKVFNTFGEFAYEYNTKNVGEDPTTWSFEYKYLGNETIDGVETKYYTMTQVENGEPKVSEGWYDNTWSAVKYKDASGEQTGVNASFAGSTLTMMTQLYCNQALINLAVYTNDWALDDTLYEVIETRNENMDLGYGSTEVEIQDIKSNFADLIMRNGYAQFIDKKLFIILEQETSDGSTAGLTVTKAIPN